MEANEAMKAMARRVVARFYQGIRDHDYAQWVLEGRKDDTSGVQIALAAIMETQRLDAELAEARFAEGGWDAGHSNAGIIIGGYIRTGEHYALAGER